LPMMCKNKLIFAGDKRLIVAEGVRTLVMSSVSLKQRF